MIQPRLNIFDSCAKKLQMAGKTSATILLEINVGYQWR